MRLLILLLILCGCAYVAWDARLATHPLPHRTELVDKQKRTLEVDIIGTNGRVVLFRRVSDGLEYTFPVKDLNIISKYKVLRLQKASEEEGTNAIASGRTVSNTTANYTNNLRKQLEENHTKIRALEVQISEAQLQHFGTRTTVTAKERSLQREIERLVTDNIRIQNRLNEIAARGH